MHPLLNQHMAALHRQHLRHEADVERMAALAQTANKNRGNFLALIPLLRSLYSRITLLSRWSRRQPEPEKVTVAKIKPAVLTTFTVLHEGGLVSDYDDQFIEQFVQTLEQELTQQAKCNCS